MSPSEESDHMKITPLGSGQEVGRSCHVVQFKDKKIMLDCGIHPGLTGMDALPFVDMIEADQVGRCEDVRNIISRIVNLLVLRLTCC